MTTFFLVAGVLMLGRAQDAKRYALAGLMMGLLVLTRPQYMPFVALCALVIGWSSRRCAHRWRGVLAYVAVVACLLGGWIVRNWDVHHRLAIGSTEGGLTAVECNNPVSLLQNQGQYTPGFARSQKDILAAATRLGEADLDRWLYRRSLGYVASHPAAFGRAFLRRIWYLWRPMPRLATGSYSWLHAAVMLGTWCPVFGLAVYAIVVGRFWRLRQQWPILLALLWVSIAAGLIRGAIRYRAPVEPFVVCYAAVAVSRLGRRGHPSRRLPDSPRPPQSFESA